MGAGGSRVRGREYTRAAYEADARDDDEGPGVPVPVVASPSARGWEQLRGGGRADEAWGE